MAWTIVVVESRGKLSDAVTSWRDVVLEVFPDIAKKKRGWVGVGKRVSTKMAASPYV
ncbi:hypothetical protein [Nostoc commune]|uniref:hypothetical protein n=1 Tax=Nostoc commune TaxID=1178 RepID=UPI0015E7E70A|nr:hypothetical protein [Nostoc commune]